MRLFCMSAAGGAAMRSGMSARAALCTVWTTSVPSTPFLYDDYYYYSVELAKDESAGEELTAMFEADGLSEEDTSSHTAPPVSAQPICS